MSAVSPGRYVSPPIAIVEPPGTSGGAAGCAGGATSSSAARPTLTYVLEVLAVQADTERARPPPIAEGDEAVALMGLLLSEGRAVSSLMVPARWRTLVRGRRVIERC